MLALDTFSKETRLTRLLQGGVGASMENANSMSYDNRRSLIAHQLLLPRMHSEEIVHSGGHVLHGVGDDVHVIGTLARWERTSVPFP